VFHMMLASSWRGMGTLGRRPKVANSITLIRNGEGQVVGK